MHFIFKLLSKILIILLFIIFIVIAIKNNISIEFKITEDLKFQNIPLILIIFISFLLGSIINFIFLFLNKK